MPAARDRAARPPFRPVVKRVTRSDVRYSYAPGCPVGPSQLRKLRISYHGFDGQVHRGTLIVASWAVTTSGISGSLACFWNSSSVAALRSTHSCGMPL